MTSDVNKMLAVIYLMAPDLVLMISPTNVGKTLPVVRFPGLIVQLATSGLVHTLLSSFMKSHQVTFMLNW